MFIEDSVINLIHTAHSTKHFTAGNQGSHFKVKQQNIFIHAENLSKIQNIKVNQIPIGLISLHLANREGQSSSKF